MKRWHKRTICILLAGALGLGALSVRTAIEPDRQLTTRNNPLICPISADATLTLAEHCWELYPEHTQDEVFRCLRPEKINIRVRCEHSKLIADYDTPVLHAADPTQLVETQYDAYILYTPPTHHEASYTFCLHCTVKLNKPFWQKPQTSTRSYIFRIEQPSTTQAEEQPTTGAPAEASTIPATTQPVCTGSARQQCLSALTHELICLSQQANAVAISNFIQHAKQANTTHTDATLPWPSCWQEAEEDARNASAQIQDAIIAIRNNNYHDSAELADFIAGECFSRIFGSAHRGNDSVFIGDELGTGLEDMIFIKCEDDDFSNDE